MASEILRVDNQETLEALQREADELKKKLEDEKAKLKDIESKCPRKNVIVGVFGLLSWFFFALSFCSEKLSHSTHFRTIFCEACSIRVKSISIYLLIWHNAQLYLIIIDELQLKNERKNPTDSETVILLLPIKCILLLSHPGILALCNLTLRGRKFDPGPVPYFRGD